MTATYPATTTPDDADAHSCSLDRPCPPGAGCSASVTARGATTKRKGFLFAGAGLACLLGCLGTAFVAGGLAAAGGALTGELWIAVAAGVIVAGGVVLRRRGRGGAC